MCIGDWLAYGEAKYQGPNKEKKVPMAVYERAAKLLGCSEGYLRNLKWACSKIPPSRRTDSLSVTHMVEIVSKSEPREYPKWISEVSEKKLSVKKLREALKESQTSYKIEPKDGGTSTFLEKARQFSRSYITESPGWTARYRKAVLDALGPILEDLQERHL
jgi:hypothetical protein